MSAKVGTPVRMQWMRWDQHGWDPWGPSHMYDVKMGVDANGKIVAADWVSLRPGEHEHVDRPRADGQRHVGARARATAVRRRRTRRSTTIPARRVLAKTQPLYGGSFRNSALRAPNAPQSYFASEQIVDELAYAANMDPIAFRKQNIDGSTIARRTLAVGHRRGDDGGRLEAEGGGVEPAERATS